eukprot:TRINITY_DN36944_c0_g3_i2.p1 TRINITY_DN36944_c0_g3~~TRINITY_DN36944_c0_g3_i2.p1  ORF type:complete len:184 (+),score=12.76 TRINITY_DN36944_c0_g3_i2:254-805(+)
MQRRLLYAAFATAVGLVVASIVHRALRGGTQEVDDRTGYWAPITSNIDWCEPNYLHSYYVAEVWNALTSIAISFPGLYLLRKAAVHKLIWPYWFQAFNVTCVGLGSVLFHGTLTRWGQWLDEAPMFAAASTASVAYFAGIHGTSSPAVRIYAAVWIALVLLVCASLFVLPHGIAAATFQILFG